MEIRINYYVEVEKKKWQARRDSNPQHPDLESGALPIRATGLNELLEFLYYFFQKCNLFFYFQ